MKKRGLFIFILFFFIFHIFLKKYLNFNAFILKFLIIIVFSIVICFIYMELFFIINLSLLYQKILYVYSRVIVFFLKIKIKKKCVFENTKKRKVE